MTATRNKKRSIGDIVYIISEKAQTIIPALIIEETTVSTLEGKKTSWKFVVGPAHKQKIINSDELKSEVYSSLEEVEELLSKRFQKLVKDAVQSATTNQNNWYGPMLKNKKETQKTTNESKDLDTESFLSNLSGVNSTESNEILHEKIQQFSEEEKKDSLRNQLKQQIAPDEEELRKDVEYKEDAITQDSIKQPQHGPGDSTQFITMPDGQRVPVKMEI